MKAIEDFNEEILERIIVEDLNDLNQEKDSLNPATAQHHPIELEKSSKPDKGDICKRIPDGMEFIIETGIQEHKEDHLKIEV